MEHIKLNRSVSEEIILNKTLYLAYQYMAGLINTKSKGNLKLMDKTIVLKSSEEYLTNQIKVKEYIDKGKIVITDSERIVGVYVVLGNDQNVLETDDKGFIDIEKQKS